MSDPAACTYVYRLSPPVGYYELAALEFSALTGEAVPSSPRRNEYREAEGLERLVRARVGVDLLRSAYVAECFRLLAEAPSLQDLLVAAEKLLLRRERFRVSVRRIGEVAAPPSQEIERAVADIIEGRPDLSRPTTVIVVVAREGDWLLGELVSRTCNGWRGHEQRPFQYSSALPPRIGRALVNLVAAPGDRLIDPCCGVGTVLVEASAMGIEPFGWEINAALAEHAAANLCHHHQGASIVVGDGRTARGRWQGAVLDLPYGQQSIKDDRVCRGLVERAVEVADLVAVVTVDDMTGLLDGLGCEMLGVAELIKSRLIRRVHWARTG